MDVDFWKLLIQFGLLVMGGSIGSFLNVVIYRLPTGKGIAWPGSHCPNCQQDIRWYDNIPVWSWFWLNGRCRDCGVPFSVRYAVIEALVALLFVWLGNSEGLSGAANIPWESAQESGTDDLFGNGQSWAICVYHLCLICMLICVVTIHGDGNRIPVRLLVFGLVVGLIAPMCFADLHPVLVMSDWIPVEFFWASTFQVVASVLIGCLLGYFVALFEWGERGWTRWNYLAGGLLVGGYLGWQATVAIALGSWLVQIHVKMLFRKASPRIFSWVFYLVLGVLIWILNWKTIIDRYF